MKKKMDQPSLRKRQRRWGKVCIDLENKEDELRVDQISCIVENGTIISINPVDMLYVEKPFADYVQSTVDTELCIHSTQKHDDGDIFCFLPTGEDVDRAMPILVLQFL